MCVCVCLEQSMQAAVKAAKGINYALATIESCLKARARSNPRFIGYRCFVMATCVAFTHVEALFPRVPAGDSQLFNVPASIELFTGVLCFYKCQVVYPPKQEQGFNTTRVCSFFKKLNLNSAKLNQMCTDLQPTAVLSHVISHWRLRSCHTGNTSVKGNIRPFPLIMLGTDLNRQCAANPSAMVKESDIRIYVTCSGNEVIRSLYGATDTNITVTYSSRGGWEKNSQLVGLLIMV